LPSSQITYAWIAHHREGFAGACLTVAQNARVVAFDEGFECFEARIFEDLLKMQRAV
jgi:hypothetical protein